MGAIALMFLFPFLVMGLIISSHDDDEPEGETLTGTDGGDLLQGGAGDDTLVGGDGQDTLLGGGGNDDLWLGEGDDGDTFAPAGMPPGAIDDLIYGGDTPALQSFVDANTYFGGDGGEGNDYVDAGPGHDVLTGGAGNDFLRGSSGHDFLVDLQGANTLHGGYGDDELWALDPDGPEAPDLLQGWAGDDDLLGDDGDTMAGGEGEDWFAVIWKSGDAPVTVTDLDPVSETVVVETIDLPAGSTLTLVDNGDGLGAEVQLNGETIAFLNGLTAAQMLANSGSVVAVDRHGGVLLPA